MEFKHLKKFNESKIDIFSDYVNDFTDLGFSFKLAEGNGNLITLKYSGKGLEFTHIADLFIELVLRLSDKYIITRKSISFEDTIQIVILFFEDSKKDFKIKIEGVEYTIKPTSYFLLFVSPKFYQEENTRLSAKRRENKDLVLNCGNSEENFQIHWTTYRNIEVNGIVDYSSFESEIKRGNRWFNFEIDVDNAKIIVDLIKNDEIKRIYAGDYTKVPKNLKSKEIDEIEKYLTPENLANI